MATAAKKPAAPKKTGTAVAVAKPQLPANIDDAMKNEIASFQSRLSAPGGNRIKPTKKGFELADGSIVIPAGGTYTCRFTGRVTGASGDTHRNTVTATATDDDEVVSAVSSAAVAEVVIGGAGVGGGVTLFGGKTPINSGRGRC
jgi:hypothetical protein